MCPGVPSLAGPRSLGLTSDIRADGRRKQLWLRGLWRVQRASCSHELEGENSADHITYPAGGSAIISPMWRETCIPHRQQCWASLSPPGSFIQIFRASKLFQLLSPQIYLPLISQGTKNTVQENFRPFPHPGWCAVWQEWCIRMSS